MLRIHADDPSRRVEATFLRIERERMSGVPLLNPALTVQAIGFARWHGHWLGTLVTPWFLNLMLLPGSREGWRSVREGERVFHRFGAGELAFLGNDEEGLGEFQTCSLVSPMAGFETQLVAVDTAREALRMLHLNRSEAAQRVAGTCEPAGPSVAMPDGVTAPPSRRRFLFGRSTVESPE